jgi:hypothetical protein
VFRDGDLNGNGVTDAADLTIWRTGFGLSANASPATGDADGDGDVDGHDFLRWQHGLGAAPSFPAPEPTALLLAMQLVACACRLRSRGLSSVSLAGPAAREFGENQY